MFNDQRVDITPYILFTRDFTMVITFSKNWWSAETESPRRRPLMGSAKSVNVPCEVRQRRRPRRQSRKR